jgi:hypothetical protein
VISCVRVYRVLAQDQQSQLRNRNHPKASEFAAPYRSDLILRIWLPECLICIATKFDIHKVTSNCYQPEHRDRSLQQESTHVMVANELLRVILDSAML